MFRDYYEHEFAKILIERGEPKPKTLAEIVDQSKHSRATVFKWLKRFESLGLVRKEPLIHGRGRPKSLYHPTPDFLNSNGCRIVGLSFEKLRQVCRHRRRNYCDLEEQVCGVLKCPLIKNRGDLEENR